MLAGRSRRWFTALVLGLAVAQDPRAARADEALTLEETVRLALSVNERALKAPLRVEAAAGQLERARAAFLPTLVAGGAGTLRPTDDRNARALAGVGTLTVNQPLLNPSAFPLYAQARHQLASERWGATEDLRKLAYDAAHAFLVVLTTERLLDTAKRRLDRARQGQQDADARARAQLASSNDVTLSLVETAAAARDAAQAQAASTAPTPSSRSSSGARSRARSRRRSARPARPRAAGSSAIRW